MYLKNWWRNGKKCGEEMMKDALKYLSEKIHLRVYYSVKVNEMKLRFRDKLGDK